MGANGNFIDLAGQVFGNLTVLSRAGSRGRITTWLCRCTCGREVTKRGDRLHGGQTKSCDKHEHRWKPPRVDIVGLTTCYRVEYKIWQHMRARCENKKHDKYRIYGKLGVQVCERWKKFQNFLDDMGRRPSPKHSLDRHPDCRGNYEPGNCRWATRKEQARNTRNNVYVEYQGTRMLLVELVEKFGLSRSTVKARLKKGWLLEDAIVTPVRPKARPPQ
jgi:hypothetical protein